MSSDLTPIENASKDKDKDSQINQLPSKFESLVISKIKFLNPQNEQDKKGKLYITNPQLIESALKPYIVYTMTGTLLPCPVLRRYSDFYSLREVLLKRWPGIYIPNIPPKKALGNTENEYVEFRLRMLNNFCYQIANTSYLVNSEEVTLFLSQSTDIGDQISNLPELPYNDQLIRFKNAIIINKNDDILKSINENIIKEQINTINESYENVSSFKDFVITTQNNKEKEIKNYICLLDVFEDYEKYALIEYAEGDENKLIFGNTKNKELTEKLQIIKHQMLNPYNDIRRCLEEEQFDLSAMKETIAAISNLKSQLEELLLKRGTLNDKIIKLKSNENTQEQAMINKISQLEKEKNIMDIGVKYYEEIIKLVSVNLIRTIEEFKSEKIVNYYKYLDSFKETSRKNNKLIIELWKLIAENNNIKKINK